MDLYDSTAEIFYVAMDEELKRRAVMLNVNAVEGITRAMAAAAVEFVLPALRGNLHPSIIALRANCATLKAIQQIEELIKGQ